MTQTTFAPTVARPAVRRRRISGFKPTGTMHLGNYLGAIRPMVTAQREAEHSTVFIADLHALTVEHGPAELHARTLENSALLLAAGVDPDISTLYVQSHVPEHAELHFLLESATHYGEAHRMIQFREKAANSATVRLSLLTYPVLMAADILLHDIHDVPVGADQSQHVELTRDVAVRFNARYGDTFVVPKIVNGTVGARIMDLSDPSAKMGKTNASQGGTIRLLDSPEAIVRKVRRAVTDADGSVSYDPVNRPGVANLLEILASTRGLTPEGAAAGITSYAELKRDVADAVIDTVAPIQARHADLIRDPQRLRSTLRAGAERARERASATVRRARDAMGLVTP